MPLISPYAKPIEPEPDPYLSNDAVISHFGQMLQDNPDKEDLLSTGMNHIGSLVGDRFKRLPTVEEVLGAGAYKAQQDETSRQADLARQEQGYPETVLKAAGRGLIGGFSGLAGGGLRMIGELTGDSTPPEAGMSPAEEAGDSLAGAGKGIARYWQDFSNKYLAPDPYVMQGEGLWAGPKPVKRILAKAVEGTAEAAPLMALSGGNPYAASGLFGAQAAAQEYGQARDKGWSPDEALLPAALGGTIGAGMGLSILTRPLEKLVGPATTAAQGAASGLLHTAVTMPAMTAATNLAAKATYDPNRPIGQGVAESVVGMAPIGILHGAYAGHQMGKFIKEVETPWNLASKDLLASKQQLDQMQRQYPDNDRIADANKRLAEQIQIRDIQEQNFDQAAKNLYDNNNPLDVDGLDEIAKQNPDMASQFAALAEKRQAAIFRAADEAMDRGEKVGGRMAAAMGKGELTPEQIRELNYYHPESGLDPDAIISRGKDIRLNDLDRKLNDPNVDFNVDDIKARFKAGKLDEQDIGRLVGKNQGETRDKLQDIINSKAVEAIVETQDPSAADEVLNKARPDRPLEDRPMTPDERALEEEGKRALLKPWEMTKKDYGEFGGAAFANGKPILHKQMVEMALARGENVPPRVLAEYPDLAAKTNTANRFQAKPESPDSGLPAGSGTADARSSQAAPASVPPAGKAEQSPLTLKDRFLAADSPTKFMAGINMADRQRLVGELGIDPKTFIRGVKMDMAALHQALRDAHEDGQRAKADFSAGKPEDIGFEKEVTAKNAVDHQITTSEDWLNAKQGDRAAANKNYEARNQIVGDLSRVLDQGTNNSFGQDTQGRVQEHAQGQVERNGQFSSELQNSPGISEVKPRDVSIPAATSEEPAFSVGKPSTHKSGLEGVDMITSESEYMDRDLTRQIKNSVKSGYKSNNKTLERILDMASDPVMGGPTSQHMKDAINMMKAWGVPEKLIVAAKAHVVKLERFANQTAQNYFGNNFKKLDKDHQDYVKKEMERLKDADERLPIMDIWREVLPEGATPQGVKKFTEYVRAFWSKMSSDIKDFLYPISHAKDIETIAREMSVDNNGNPQVLAKMDYAKNEIIIYSRDNEAHRIEIRDWDTPYPYEHSTDAKGLGAIKYQIAFAWAKNNGKQFICDPAGLTEVNELRRTVLMLSSALKYSTTEHLTPGGLQGVLWRKGDDNLNVTSMALRALALMRKAMPEIKEFSYNLRDGHYYRNGEKIDYQAVKKQITDLVSPSDLHQILEVNPVEGLVHFEKTESVPWDTEPRTVTKSIPFEHALSTFAELMPVAPWGEFRYNKDDGHFYKGETQLSPKEADSELYRLVKQENSRVKRVRAAGVGLATAQTGITTTSSLQALQETGLGKSALDRTVGLATKTTQNYEPTLYSSGKSAEAAPSQERRPVANALSDLQWSGLHVPTRERLETLQRYLPGGLSAQKGELYVLGEAEVKGNANLKAVRSLVRSFISSGDVVFYRSADRNGPNGFLDPNNPRRMYINVGTDGWTHFVAGHELGHSLEKLHPDLHEQLLEAVQSNVLAPDFQRFVDTTNEARERSGLGPVSTEKAYKEMVADYLGDRFGEKTWWDKLYEASPNLVKKLVDFAQRLLGRQKNRARLFRAEDYIKNIDEMDKYLAGIMADFRMREAAVSKRVKDLVVSHQVGVEKFLKSAEYQEGIPMPSIGIRRKEGMRGDITLLGSMDMIDPARPESNVYSGDVYSPIRPRYINEIFTRDKFNDQWVQKGDNELSLENRGYRIITDTNGVVRLLGEKGQEIESFIPSDYDLDLSSLGFEESPSTSESAPSPLATSNEELIKFAKNYAYMDYVQHHKDKITITPEMIVEAMKAKPLIGKGGHPTSSHDLKVALAKKFNSVQEMHGMKHVLQSDMSGSDVKIEAIKKEGMHLQWKFNTDRETFFGALKDYALGDKKGVGALRETLQRAGILSDTGEMSGENALLLRILSLVRKIEQNPTEYYEAKPARVVGWNEWKGAVVPKKHEGLVKDVLDKHGIPYETYDSNIIGAREQATAKVIHDQDLMFSTVEPTSNDIESISNQHSLKDEPVAQARQQVAQKFVDEYFGDNDIVSSLIDDAIDNNHIPSLKALKSEIKESYINDLDDFNDNQGNHLKNRFVATLDSNKPKTPTEKVVLQFLNAAVNDEFFQHVIEPDYFPEKKDFVGWGEWAEGVDPELKSPMWDALNKIPGDEAHEADYDREYDKIGKEISSYATSIIKSAGEAVKNESKALTEAKAILIHDKLSRFANETTGIRKAWDNFTKLKPTNDAEKIVLDKWRENEETINGSFDDFLQDYQASNGKLETTDTTLTQFLINNDIHGSGSLEEEFPGLFSSREITEIDRVQDGLLDTDAARRYYGLRDMYFAALKADTGNLTLQRAYLDAEKVFNAEMIRALLPLVKDKLQPIFEASKRLAEQQLKAGVEGYERAMAALKGETQAPELSTASQAAPSKSSGVKAADIEATIDPMVSRWKNAPFGGVHVVQGVEDLPASVLAQLQRVAKRREIPFDKFKGALIKGFVDHETNTVYIVADNLKSVQKAMETLIHEVIGHYGLKGALGSRYYMFLDFIHANLPAEVQAAAKQAKIDMSDLAGQRKAASEWFAQAVEKDLVPDRVWDRLVKAVKDFARSLGFNLQMSQSEVRAMVADAMKRAKEFVEGGQTKTQGKGLALSLKDAIASLASLRDSKWNQLSKSEQNKSIYNAGTFLPNDDHIDFSLKSNLAKPASKLDETLKSLDKFLWGENRQPFPKYFGKTEKPWPQSFGEWLQAFTNKKGREDLCNKFVFSALDRLNPIKEKLGDLPYKLARMSSGAGDVVNAILEHGKLSTEDGFAPIVREQHKGLISVLQEVKAQGLDPEKLAYWMSAHRAERLEGEGKEFLLDAKARKEIWAASGGKDNAIMKAAAGKVMDLNNSVLDFAVKTGLVNREAADIWKQNLYMPFHRLFEETVTVKDNIKTPIINEKATTSGIKSIMGSKMKIGDPMENLIKNWTTLVHEGMRNIAQTKALETSKTLGLTSVMPDGKTVSSLQELGIKDLMKIFGTEVKKTWAVMTAGNQWAMKVFDTREAAESWMASPDGQKRAKGEPLWAVMRKETFTTATPKAMMENSVIMFQREGKPVYVKVNDPELYVALTNLKVPAFNKFASVLFGGPKRLLTIGATIGPAFRVANFLRDSLHTALISHSFTPFIDSYRGALKILRNDPAAIAFMSGGGGQSASYLDSPDMAKHIQRIVQKEGQGALGRILDKPRKLLDWWQKIGEASESAARVELYSKRIAEGKSHMEAVFEARDLLDFSMSGASGAVQFLTQTVPFMNARMQGLYRLGRTMADPKERSAFAVKGAMLMAASLALYGAFKDDKRWKELEDWDKVGFFHWWVGKEHFRLPKPFEVGAIFSTLPTAFVESTLGDERGRHIWDVTKAILSDTFAFDPMPQVFKPAYETFANKSSFTGRAIVGRHLEGLIPSEQFDSSSSATTRLLAGKLNISPKKAEYLLKGYFSDLAVASLGVMDIFTSRMGNFPTKPASKIDDWPLAGRFIKDSDSPRTTKYMTRYYDMFNEADELAKTIAHYRQSGQADKIQGLVTGNEQKLAMEKPMQHINLQLSKLSAQARRIEFDRTMAADQKRAQLDAIDKSRNALAQRGYELGMRHGM